MEKGLPRDGVETCWSAKMGFSCSWPSFMSHRGTSLIRAPPTVGPYSRAMPRAIWWPNGGWQFLMGEVPLYDRGTLPWPSHMLYPSSCTPPPSVPRRVPLYPEAGLALSAQRLTGCVGVDFSRIVLLSAHRGWDFSHSLSFSPSLPASRTHL